jgi:ATP-dependent Clp protease adapter protein ClpS
MSKLATLNPSAVLDVRDDRGWQVILYNDEVNHLHRVIRWLQEVFGHPQGLAIKIAWEAHQHGKAIAQVEGHDEALLHKEQLQSFGLGAAVEPLQ